MYVQAAWDQEGVSAPLGMDFVSSTTQRPRDLGASPQDSLHASSRPTSHSVLVGLQLSLPQSTHRMWSALDLPLLRNTYSVLFAKYESELLTPGADRRQGLLGREPPSSRPPQPLPENPPCQRPQALGKFVPLGSNSLSTKAAHHSRAEPRASG